MTEIKRTQANRLGPTDCKSHSSMFTVTGPLCPLCPLCCPFWALWAMLGDLYTQPQITLMLCALTLSHTGRSLHKASNYSNAVCIFAFVWLQNTQLLFTVTSKHTVIPTSSTLVVLKLNACKLKFLFAVLITIIYFNICFVQGDLLQSIH